jgi:hypothetical protein
MATEIGVSANTGTGPTMGNPALRPDGTVQGVSPPPAIPATAALVEPLRPAQQTFDRRMPKIISPLDQAEASGADPQRYGNIGPANMAEELPKSSAALMNAAPARRTG